MSERRAAGENGRRPRARECGYFTHNPVPRILSRAMTISALLNAALAGHAEPTLSYELFPPRTPAAEDTLLETMTLLAATREIGRASCRERV